MRETRLIWKNMIENNQCLSSDESTELSQKPDDVLEMIGSSHPRILMAILSCSFVWAFGAIAIMSSAFITIDCGDCNETLITIVSEFNLRGEKAYLADWSTSFFMVGNMVGGSTLTHAGDRFGRRPILLICLVSLAITACLASLSTSIYLFAACRLLQGACYTGVNLVAWVAAYEHSPTAFRSFTTFFFGFSWVLGYCIVAPLAYFSPNWRIMLSIVSGPTLLFALWCYGFVPETLHYLVSKRSAKNIHKWLSKIGSKSVAVDIIALMATSTRSRTLSTQSSFLQEILANKIFIIYCLIQLYLWTCDNFIYFGLSLYSTQLAGNLYINYICMGLVELPAYIIAPIILEKLGRKLVVAGAHILAGACFFLPLFLPEHEFIMLTCWLLGKFAISCSFMSLFVYATEIFPTSIRNVLIGMCSVVSRIGGIAAPYIRFFGSISPVMPIIILGTMSSVAGILTVLLPETHRKPLPVTIKQIPKE